MGVTNLRHVDYYLHDNNFKTTIFKLCNTCVNHKICPKSKMTDVPFSFFIEHVETITKEKEKTMP